jgi:FtsZ-binding cell division protein ZapB
MTVSDKATIARLEIERDSLKLDLAMAQEQLKLKDLQIEALEKRNNTLELLHHEVTDEALYLLEKMEAVLRRKKPSR